MSLRNVKEHRSMTAQQMSQNLPERSPRDFLSTLIITNFHLHLIQLWWQFFQNFVYGEVVYAQTWEVLTLKNCIEPP